jgi:hypothetical protein
MGNPSATSEQRFTARTWLSRPAHLLAGKLFQPKMDSIVGRPKGLVLNDKLASAKTHLKAKRKGHLFRRLQNECVQGGTHA